MINIQEYDQIIKEAGNGSNAEPDLKEVLHTATLQRKIQERYIEKHGTIKTKIKEGIVYAMALNFIGTIVALLWCLIWIFIPPVDLTKHNVDKIYLAGGIMVLQVIMSIIISLLTSFLIGIMSGSVVHILGKWIRKDKRVRVIKEEMLQEYQMIREHRGIGGQREEVVND